MLTRPPFILYRFYKVKENNEMPKNILLILINKYDFLYKKNNFIIYFSLLVL